MTVKETDGVKYIHANGVETPYVGELSLERMKKYIKCDLVEYCLTNDGDMMVIDESGKLDPRKPLNLTATYLYEYSRKKNGRYVDYIVGCVVLIPAEVFKAWDNENEEQWEDDECE